MPQACQVRAVLLQVLTGQSVRGLGTVPKPPTCPLAKRMRFCLEKCRVTLSGPFGFNGLNNNCNALPYLYIRVVCINNLAFRCLRREARFICRLLKKIKSGGASFALLQVRRCPVHQYIRSLSLLQYSERRCYSSMQYVEKKLVWGKYRTGAGSVSFIRLLVSSPVHPSGCMST